MQSRSLDRAGWPVPFAYLPKPLLEPTRPEVSILVGWLTAFIPSILLGILVSNLMHPSQQPQLALGTLAGVVLVAVVAPVIETLIMAGVLAVLLRFLPPAAAVSVSALGWGVAHSLAAPAWGLVIWWPFLVFSTLYVTWRERSLWAALGVPAAVHGLQNLVPATAAFAGLNL